MADEFLLTSPTSPNSGANIMRFGGGLTGLLGVATYFLADDIALSTQVTALQYPVASQRQAQNLSVFVRSNTLTSATTITVFKNGVATGITVVIGALATGLFQDLVDTAAFAAGDTIDLQASNPGALGLVILFSATVELA